jgi:DMSO/TMAO reductase YedYZ molybdopterin-dependent catalytic subunit
VTTTTRERLLLGATAGLLSAAAGVGASVVVSALVGGAPTPITAVGSRIIDATPGAVKDWAIRTLGTYDKPFLLGGIFIVLALIACLTGVVAWRSRRLALALTVALGLLGIAAAYADRTELVGSTSRLAPAFAALVVSVGMLAWFTASWGVHVADTGSKVPDDSLPSDSPIGHSSYSDNIAPAGFDRRAFLAAALVSSAAAATGFATSRVFTNAGAKSRSAIRLPRPTSAAPVLAAGANLDVAGISPYLTRSEDFYRVDTALLVPQVSAADWTLRIHGLVDREIELSFEDLLNMPLIERRITLACVSNEVGGDYIGNATWLGVRIDELLKQAGVSADADAVKSTAADGFTVGTPLGALTDGRDAMIAIGMNGEPLPLEHGFPARMVVPGLYGYVSATKWLVDMELTRFDDFTAYWTDRGWDAEAPIKTMSRIDVPAGFARVRAGRVAVAGVAWAQHTGIKTVEVRADGAAWEHAWFA